MPHLRRVTLIKPIVGVSPPNMPPQALALAFAASIYPPAIAAVIAFGRGSQVRSRVFVFAATAALVTYASGALVLFVLSDIGATAPNHQTPSAALDLTLGDWRCLPASSRAST